MVGTLFQSTEEEDPATPPPPPPPTMEAVSVGTPGDVFIATPGEEPGAP
jgi:hypothetical protein